MKKIFSVILSLIISSAVVAGTKDTTAYQFSLQQAIQYAFDHQSITLNALLDEKIANAKVDEYISTGLPQINANADLQDFLGIPTTFVPGEFTGGPAGSVTPVQFGTQYNTSAGVTASQLIFDGSFFVGIKAARNYAEFVRKNTTRSKIETTVTISKLYYSVLVSKDRMDALDANIERVKKSRDDTKAFYDQGFVEKLDLDRIDLGYNNLLVERQRTERLLNLSTALLKFQMGMDPKGNLELTDKLSEVSFDQSLLQKEADVKSRIEYDLAQTQKYLMELDMKRTKYGYAPTINANGSYGFNAASNEFDMYNKDKKWYPTAIVGLTLKLPIFDGMQKHDRIQQQKFGIEQVSNNLKTLENSISLEVSTAQANMQNSIQQMEIAKKNLELAKEVVRVTRIKYEQGVGSNLELTTAESDLRQSQTDYSESLYGVLVNKVDLEKALGILKY